MTDDKCHDRSESCVVCGYRPPRRTPQLLEILVRRGVVTTDPADRDECCGLPRDEDGFCTYREGHPIYVDPTA